MSDEITRLPDAHSPLTRPGIQHHFCEHPGCGKNAGWGFAKPRQTPHWFCSSTAPKASDIYEEAWMI